MFGETEIKEARVVESVKVGNDATILASDKENIWYNTEKYIYDSDDAEGKTVAEDGTTVVTISFRKASTTPYSVNLVNSADESVLVEDFATGNIVEGEITKVYYHKAINIGGKWYVREKNSEDPLYGIVVAAGLNKVAYTLNENVSYFIEVEDLPVEQGGTFAGWRNDGNADRSSGGVAPRHYGKNYAYTEALAGGIYDLTMNARNCSSSSDANTILAIMDAEGNITELETQFDNWGKAQTAEKTISVSIPDGAKFVLKCGNDNSNLNMDFLMFVRTGDYTVSKTITAAGWATYCSPYALDFTGEIANLTDVYIIDGVTSGTTLNLVSVKGKTVPANTGLLIEGIAGTCAIPVAASGTADVSANDLVGTTVEATLDATTGYVLMGSPAVGFYKNNNDFTLGANTAYLPADFAGADARDFFGFDYSGEATGINAVEGAKQSMEGVYNLNGQRVAQPTRGLYIVNGRKVVVK